MVAKPQDEATRQWGPHAAQLDCALREVKGNRDASATYVLDRATNDANASAAVATFLHVALRLFRRQGTERATLASRKTKSMAALAFCALAKRI